MHHVNPFSEPVQTTQQYKREAACHNPHQSLPPSVPSYTSTLRNHPKMMNRDIPYILEDRTGSHTASDFDDVYDRIFFRVAPSPRKSDEGSLMIYDIGSRSSSQGRQFHHSRKPCVILQFGPNRALGTISFVKVLTLPMNQYLKKTSLFGGSLSRKFRASDRQEYRWTHRTVEGQEWSCLNSDHQIIAHYDLRPPDRIALGTSGNMLTISTPYTHLTLELLSSLTIMRHIAEYNL